MNFELSGKLIEKYDTVQVTDTFTKREFVVEIENATNPEWNDFVKLQLLKDKCDLIDRYNTGDLITVNFNVKGRAWKKNEEAETVYFNSLDAWKIKAVEGEAKETSNEVPAEGATEDSLPF